MLGGIFLDNLIVILIYSLFNRILQKGIMFSCISYIFTISKVVELMRYLICILYQPFVQSAVCEKLDGVLFEITVK